jgi:CheY-like chemotaxis protein
LAQGSETKPLRILLVDDDPLIRTLGRELLSSLGYEVEMAADGMEVLERCGLGQLPDLVILDFHLPGMDGLEVARRLKALYPGVRVLAASGFFSAQDAADLKDAGAAGFISKPFRLAELQARIEEIMGGSLGR